MSYLNYHHLVHMDLQFDLTEVFSLQRQWITRGFEEQEGFGWLCGGTEEKNRQKTKK